MSRLGDLDHQLIIALGLSGILMGIVVAFGITQDSLWGELIAWCLIGILWIWAVRRQGVERPFLSLVLVGVLAGALFGVTTQLFWDTYLAHNPGTFTEPTRAAGQDPTSLQVRATNVAIGLVLGGVWGVVVGAVGAAAERWQGSSRNG